MNAFFTLIETSYNLRNFQSLQYSNKKTAKFGTKTITYRGPQIWNLILESRRNASSTNTFKKKNSKPE